MAPWRSFGAPDAERDRLKKKKKKTASSPSSPPSRVEWVFFFFLSLDCPQFFFTFFTFPRSLFFLFHARARAKWGPKTLFFASAQPALTADERALSSSSSSSSSTQAPQRSVLLLFVRRAEGCRRRTKTAKRGRARSSASSRPWTPTTAPPPSRSLRT